MASALGNQSNSLVCFSPSAKKSGAERGGGVSWAALGMMGIVVGAWVMTL